MVDVQKLKGKIVEKGYKQDTLAPKIGMSRSTLNRKLKTGEDFTIGETNAIVKLLKLTQDEAIAIFFTY